MNHVKGLLSNTVNLSSSWRCCLNFVILSFVVCHLSFVILSFVFLKSVFSFSSCCMHQSLIDRLASAVNSVSGPSNISFRPVTAAAAAALQFSAFSGTSDQEALSEKRPCRQMHSIGSINDPECRRFKSHPP